MADVDRSNDGSGERAAAGAPDNRVIASETLFGGGNELVIRHGTEVYRLRITRQNKLILNK